MIKTDFELPIVHIHQDTIDHSIDSIEYAIKSIVQRHQEQINIEIMKNICQIMKENGISEYYGIDEKRLLEIVDEAKAFEIIKEKGINIQELKFSYSVNEYNKCKGNENETLTQEEYDFLREVL